MIKALHKQYITILPPKVKQREEMDGLRYEGAGEGTGWRFSVERVMNASLGKERSFLGLVRECNLTELN